MANLNAHRRFDERSLPDLEVAANQTKSYSMMLMVAVIAVIVVKIIMELIPLFTSGAQSKDNRGPIVLIFLTIWDLVYQLVVLWGTYFGYRAGNDRNIRYAKRFRLFLIASVFSLFLLGGAKLLTDYMTQTRVSYFTPNIEQLIMDFVPPVVYAFVIPAPHKLFKLLTAEEERAGV